MLDLSCFSRKFSVSLHQKGLQLRSSRNVDTKLSSGTRVYIVVWVFILFFLTLCMPTVQTLIRLFLCKDLSEPRLLASARMPVYRS